jgi:DNA-binding protein
MAEQATNIVKVGSKGYHGSYVNRAKKMFAEGITPIELHGVAYAINNAVKAAEMLQSLGYANITGFNT